MTNASAMTLVLLLFIAVFFAAIFVILAGGTVFERARRPRRHNHEMEHHQRAA